ncbi:hypothetical protein MPRS_27080 [Mycobacterium paraseoulense]|nr:hypothetical protein MPRS_27080 [Mycobacterium paraseoulense]
MVRVYAWLMSPAATPNIIHTPEAPMFTDPFRPLIISVSLDRITGANGSCHELWRGTSQKPLLRWPIDGTRGNGFELACVNKP